MAWSYRGAAYDYGSSVNTLTVSKPTGTATGDFALALVCRYHYPGPTSEPSGWTLLESWAHDTYAHFRLYYRVITADEPSSWSWAWADNKKSRAWVWVFDGDYDTSDPIQASDAVYYYGAAWDIDIPTLTTNADGTISLIVATTLDTSGRTFTVPTSPAYTEHDDCGDTSSDWWAAVASYIYPDADTATGTLAYDASYYATFRAGFHILLNPATAPGTETIAGEASVTIIGEGALTAVNPLAGEASVTIIGEGALAVAEADTASIAGEASLTLVGSGALVAINPLAGTGTLTLTTQGVITAINPIAGEADVGFAAQGTLLVSGETETAAAFHFLFLGGV